MPKLVILLLVVGGFALGTTGIINDHGLLAAGGGVLFFVGGIAWIASPTKPPLDKDGNRPTHDPINQVGPLE